MGFQWNPYRGITGCIEDDLEILMLYSSPTQGVSKVDIHQYLNSVTLVYSKIITITRGYSTTKVANEISFKNREFYEKDLPKAFENGRYIGISKTEELLTKFLVPEI